MSENKMTPTPWSISPFKSGMVGINYDNPLISETICQITGSHPQYNAAAIVSAINGTYGIGIDPDAIKELQESLEQFTKYPWLAKAIEDAGGTPNLERSKAAIEKAKLNQ